MIDLYLWTTPNGFKPLVMLEEIGLPFTPHAVNISKGEQHEEAYLKINPNGKIPAIVDHTPSGDVRVFESGAILIYLAEKTGKLLPTEAQARADVLAWLMFQMSGVGPMFGQWGHFRGAKREDTYGLERYEKESQRLLGVLEKQLATSEYLAGEYSIADIATYPWVSAVPKFFGQSFDAFPSVAKWVERVGARPAVARAMAWKPTV